MNQCYTCKYRRDIPGNCHSSCAIGMEAYVNPDITVPKVVGDPHGSLNGWFMYPFNFDPVWLNSCDSYVSTEKENV